MGVVDPYVLAVRFSAKYRLSESQEQILRALLAGLTDDVISRFEGRRRSIETIHQHRKTMLGEFDAVDRQWFALAVWWNRRKRNKQLRKKLKAELENRKP